MNNLLIGIRLASIKKAKEKFADEHSRELKSCHAARRQVKDYLNEKGEFDKDRVEWERDKVIQQMDQIDQREASGRSLVIRPPHALGIGRTEKDPDALERVYRLGVSEAEHRLAEIRDWVGPSARGADQAAQ